MEPSDNNLLERRGRGTPGGRRKYDKPKEVIQSRTVICAAVGMAASVAGFFGYTMSCEGQQELTDNLIPVITFFSSFGAFIFRLLAKRRIG